MNILEKIVKFLCRASSPNFLRKPKEVETSQWIFDTHIEDEDLTSNDPILELKIPSGWSPEQYLIWLESEMPEGWTREQWDEFTAEQSELLKNQEF